MAAISFVFDVIVKNIEMQKLKSEDYQKLQVEAQFNNRLINITSSRIKVSDFNPNASTHFTASDEVLRKNVGDCGMSMSVRMNRRDIGSATAAFPDSFIDKIKADMSDLVHEGSLTLVRDKQKVGTLDFKCRLIIKCETADEKDCRQYLDNSIRPQDILFLLGESQKCIHPCDPCANELEPEDGDERLALNLQRFRSVPGPAQAPKEASPTEGFASELKKMAKECEETIDAILNGTKPPMLPLPKGMVIDSDNDNENADKESASEKADKEQNVPEGTIPGVSPIRCCPICLNNMSWLPKFATCPRCGSKPMPVVEAKHKKELTPDEIILEFLGKPELTTEELCETFKEEAEDDEKTEEEVQCRCTCKKGKICAHCRVREACKDIFKLSDKRSPGAGHGSKQVKKAESQRRSAVQDHDLVPYTDLELEPYLDSDVGGSVRKAGLYGARESRRQTARGSIRRRRDGSVPGINSPQSEGSISKEEFDERRTFLARVFSELCLLYNIKTDNSAEQKKDEENSESDMNRTSMSSAKRDSKRESKRDSKRDSKRESRRDSTRDSNVRRISTKSNKSNEEKRNSKRLSKRIKWRSNISVSSESSSLPSVVSQEILDDSEDDGLPLIPARLGWDWREDPASKKGWRPGAVRKPIKKIMDFFLQENSKATAAEITKKLEMEQLEKERNALTMLHVSKKNGEISITFRSVDPAKPKDPIIYKVMKSDQAVRLSEMKKKFKENGFRKCTCHQSLMLCVCRTTEEKRELQDALEEECASRRTPYCPDELVLTDTTDSEMEYDFEVSPLMGAPVIPPADGPNSRNINRATQTAEDDLVVQRKYPNLQENPYYIPYNCATRNVLSGQNGEDEEEDGDSARNKENGGGDNRRVHFSRARNSQNQPNRGRGFGNNNTRNPRNRSARDPGSKSGNKRNNSKSGGKPGEKGGNGTGNKSNAMPVALPKRLQKDPKAVEKAEAAEKKKKDEEKQKAIKKKLIEMTKAPSIDKNKTRRALLTKILPDVDNIPRLGRGIAALDDCPCDRCAMADWRCNPCFTPNAFECPCYYYCC